MDLREIVQMAVFRKGRRHILFFIQDATASVIKGPFTIAEGAYFTFTLFNFFFS